LRKYRQGRYRRPTGEGKNFGKSNLVFAIAAYKPADNRPGDLPTVALGKALTSDRF
jgi:hypothetical protein